MFSCTRLSGGLLIENLSWQVVYISGALQGFACSTPKHRNIITFGNRFTSRCSSISELLCKLGPIHIENGKELQKAVRGRDGISYNPRLCLYDISLSIGFVSAVRISVMQKAVVAHVPAVRGLDSERQKTYYLSI